MASELALSLGITVSRLFELHPSLPWRSANMIEKKDMATQGLTSASFVTLLSVKQLYKLGWGGQIIHRSSVGNSGRPHPSFAQTRVHPVLLNAARLSVPVRGTCPWAHRSRAPQAAALSEKCVATNTVSSVFV